MGTNGGATMPDIKISYQKLRDLAKEHGGLYRLKSDKVIGTATLDKIRTNTGHITTASVQALCEYYSAKTARTIQPGDLMEYVPSGAV